MKLLIAIILTFFSFSLMGQATSGTVDISVTTLDNNAKYHPDHVLAIWIEDDAGAFVKTLKKMGNGRDNYLLTWNAKSGGSTTDAITGPTLSTHTTHNISWDCSNTSEGVVEDGSYAVRVEYTSANSQGPITTINFIKAADEFTFQPANETYFIDMDLVYTPGSTTGIDAEAVSYKLSAYPNPASEQVSINMTIPSERSTSIKIYQSDMRLVNVLWEGSLSAGDHRFIWNLSSSNGRKVAAGTYFLVVNGTNHLSTRQIIVK